MTPDLEQTPRVALVTGGAQGIGWATCETLAEVGWHVAIADVNHAAARERAASKPDRMIGLQLDVTDRGSIDAAVEAIIARFGRIDLLVNNAGIQSHAPLETFTWDAWSRVIDVNLSGVFRCMQAVGKHMLRAGGGSIVNIVSISAERGTPGRSPYVASKAAVIGLTRTAAVEWASRGVRVNAVGPGYVDTPLLQDYIRTGKLDVEPVLDRTPLRRMAQPHEIAHAIQFLASENASFITGQVLYVDGGFLANYGVQSSATSSF